MTIDMTIEVRCISNLNCISLPKNVMVHMSIFCHFLLVSISLTPQMLCAGVENTILSGCHGDSGGPYVCLNSDKKTYTLHGAVSWGSGSCNAKQLFTVFARVTQFRAWIQQHTGVVGGGLKPLSINGFPYC